MESNENGSQSSANSHTGNMAGAETRVWNSEQILGESNEVLIVHGNETYRLRRTRLGKLILQK